MSTIILYFNRETTIFTEYLELDDGTKTIFTYDESLLDRKERLKLPGYASESVHALCIFFGKVVTKKHMSIIDKIKDNPSDFCSEMNADEVIYNSESITEAMNTFRLYINPSYFEYEMVCEVEPMKLKLDDQFNLIKIASNYNADWFEVFSAYSHGVECDFVLNKDTHSIYSLSNGIEMLITEIRDEAFKNDLDMLKTIVEHCKGGENA